MDKAEAERLLMHGNVFEADAAIEFLQRHPSDSDLPKLVSAFQHRRELIVQLDIVDVIGLIHSESACKVLRDIVRGPNHYLVRYFAMRSLIDLKCGEWRLASRIVRNSDFYDSLSAYEQHVKGELSSDGLRNLAKSRTRRPGDHWEWLTYPI
jgi:hypothetical protein